MWIEQQVDRLEIVDGIAILAPPKFVGALRQAWSPRLAMRIKEYQSDLANLSPADVARHSCVTSLME